MEEPDCFGEFRSNPLGCGHCDLYYDCEKSSEVK
jgi:hypothetical protein